jgi:hypothetical protein
LLNRYRVKSSIEGSNPSLSATEYFSFRICHLPAANSPHSANKRCKCLIERTIYLFRSTIDSCGIRIPQWAVMGWPGQTGQISAAGLSQTVKTKFTEGRLVSRVPPTTCCADLQR